MRLRIVNMNSCIAKNCRNEVAVREVGSLNFDDDQHLTNTLLPLCDKHHNMIKLGVFFEAEVELTVELVK